MRVLLLADDCNPEWPSLPVVGYKACKAIAERVETVVVTQLRNRENLEKHGFGKARVEYLDTEYVARPISKLSTFLRGGDATGWTTGVALAYLPYLAFEYETWRSFKSELLGGRFDIVHRITPMSPTLPSWLASKLSSPAAHRQASTSPVPFVIGPLNGGLKWPPGFTAELHREREWMTYVRGAAQFLPFHRSTYAKSAAILAGFEHTIRDIPPGNGERIINFPEVGIDPEVFSATADSGKGAERVSDRLNFVFVGRLVPYKCADVAIRAFAASPALRKHKLRIVGDGPERPALEALVDSLGARGSITFEGWKKQAEVGEIMRSSEVFVFPSVRELGAGVVVEAMACGMVPVVVDYGGPGGLVGPDRGVKVPIGSKDAIVRAMSHELEALAARPERILKLSQTAREYALKEYSWAAKADKTVEVYKWVLGQRADRPEFPGLVTGEQSSDKAPASSQAVA
jgi:glycosyltransferase involved in cell wall biosynthesis